MTQKRIQYLIFILIYLAIFTTCSSGKSPGHVVPVAKNGILDLRDWDLYNDGEIILAGEWDFFWEQFILDVQNGDNSDRPSDGFIILPGTWEHRIRQGKSLPQEGYASFKLKVLTRPLTDRLALRIYEQTNPLEVFVNNAIITKIGKVARFKEEEIYHSYPHIASFSYSGNSFDIVIHASNFRYRKLAGQKPIVLGMSERLLKNRTRELIFEFFISACFLRITVGCPRAFLTVTVAIILPAANTADRVF